MTETKIKGLKIFFYPKNMKILDSYQITNKNKMIEILTEALSKTDVFDTPRTIKSLLRQWEANNKLYKIGFKKIAKDCNFKRHIKLYKKIYFSILSFSFEKINIFKKIKRFFLIKKQEYKYKKYIKEHRDNVFKAFLEMQKCPLIYQYCDEKLIEKLKSRILIHDMSKYSKEEFDAYRKNFFPINNSEKENNKENFEKAWQHHWQNNPHHWQYRQNKKDFSKENDEDILNVLENICDWLAMGYKFNDRPYQYYEKNKEKILLNKEETKFLEHIIYDGIDAKYIQKEGGNG